MKYKVLFVTNHFRFSNGVASVLRSLIENLDKDKYEVSLLVLYDYNKDFAEPIIDRINVIKGFGFYFRGFDKIVNLMPEKLIYSLFVKNEYDLEVAFQYGMPTKMISASNNIHKMCWMHTFDENMVLRQYYEKFPRIINVARIGTEKLINAGFNRDNCDYCYNIIDEEKISLLANEDPGFTCSHSKCIITVARLAPDKGFMRYLECITRILEQEQDVEFWIVGDGSEFAKMETYISSHHLQNNVKLIGAQENPFKFLKQADLYFCCSFREGFSTACQEAAIMGVPVMSVSVDGAEELIECAGCGKVIDNSKEAIEKELIDYLKDHNKAESWKKIANTNKNKFYKAERIKKIEYNLDLVIQSEVEDEDKN